MFKKARKYLVSLLSDVESPDGKWDNGMPLIPEDKLVPLPNLDKEELDDSNFRIRYNDLFHHGQLLNSIAIGLNEHHFKSGIRFGVLENRLGFLYGIIFTIVSAAVGVATKEIWEPVAKSILTGIGIV